ncbi:hypothetical protein V493_07840 [Pseudogymnoascus sp. VKM F-4281 (FW-2241)]|nr:hypothetical protein V493_07840 [Pseudogymnoascus sp. VKM F-4281 (FW-2241)]
MSVSPPSCNILGDPDLYGLGVRLAVYAQAVTYLCATAYSKSPLMILEIPCALLNIAVNSVLVLRAFQRRLRPFDTMLALFTAGTLSIIAPFEEDMEWERRGRTIGGKIVTLMQTYCNVLQLGFGTWAVMNDMVVDINSDAETCPVWIYVFSKHKNSGWALNVWKGFYGFVVSLLTLRWMWRRRIVRDAVRKIWQGVLRLWIGMFSLISNKPPAEKAIRSKSNATSTENVSKTAESIKVPALARSPLTRLPLDPQINKIRIMPRSGQVENLDMIPTQQLPAKRPSSRPKTIALFYALF